MHEAQLHEHSVFVTLTYSDEHLGSFSLVYSDFQKFMKRVRKKFGPVRFYVAGEYGDGFQRPHFHCLLFGCWFPDREFHKDLPSGFRLYRSAQLEKLWPFGFSSIGDVTFESAAYVARYVMKKVTGKAAEQHYEFVDIGSGEVSQRVPEFNRMSLKPGIGAGWFKKFGNEVFPNDYVVMNGVKMSPPSITTSWPRWLGQRSSKRSSIRGSLSPQLRAIKVRTALRVWLFVSRFRRRVFHSRSEV